MNWQAEWIPGTPLPPFTPVPWSIDLSRRITVTYAQALSPETAALVWAQAQRPARPTLEATGIGYRYERPPPIRPQYAFTDLAHAQRQAEIASALIEVYRDRAWDWRQA